MQHFVFISGIIVNKKSTEHCQRLVIQDSYQRSLVVEDGLDADWQIGDPIAVLCRATIEDTFLAIEEMRFEQKKHPPYLCSPKTYIYPPFFMEGFKIPAVRLSVEQSFPPILALFQEPKDFVDRNWSVEALNSALAEAPSWWPIELERVVEDYIPEIEEPFQVRFKQAFLAKFAEDHAPYEGLMKKYTMYGYSIRPRAGFLVATLLHRYHVPLETGGRAYYGVVETNGQRFRVGFANKTVFLAARKNQPNVLCADYKSAHWIAAAAPEQVLETGLNPIRFVTYFVHEPIE